MRLGSIRHTREDEEKEFDIHVRLGVKSVGWLLLVVFFGGIAGEFLILVTAQYLFGSPAEVDQAARALRTFLAILTSCHPS